MERITKSALFFIAVLLLGASLQAMDFLPDDRADANSSQDMYDTIHQIFFQKAYGQTTILDAEIPTADEYVRRCEEKIKRQTYADDASMLACWQATLEILSAIQLERDAGDRESMARILAYIEQRIQRICVELHGRLNPGLGRRWGNRLWAAGAAVLSVVNPWGCFYRKKPHKHEKIG